jgi:hypothetical protein
MYMYIVESTDAYLMRIPSGGDLAYVSELRCLDVEIFQIFVSHPQTDPL